MARESSSRLGGVLSEGFVSRIAKYTFALAVLVAAAQWLWYSYGPVNRWVRYEALSSAGRIHRGSDGVRFLVVSRTRYIRDGFRVSFDDALWCIIEGEDTEVRNVNWPSTAFGVASTRESVTRSWLFPVKSLILPASTCHIDGVATVHLPFGVERRTAVASSPVFTLEIIDE